MPRDPHDAPRPTSPVTGAARLTPEGVEVRFTVPVHPAMDTHAPADAAPAVRPGPDFSGVVWGPLAFSFSFKQRLVVAALFEARRLGYRFVAQETLLQAAESDGGRLRDLFGRHPAWGTMIVPALSLGGPNGSYAIAEPAGRAG